MTWYTGSLHEVEQELKTNFAKGLSKQEAQTRLATYGENKLNEVKRKTLFQRFFEQLKDFMVIVLLIAAAVSLIVNILSGENEWIEPMVIVGIVILNAILGVVQESKAEAALDALKSMAAPKAKVLHDGIVEVVNSSELVPGEVILVEAGDFVPADCRLIESASLKSEESSLTGESVPVDKHFQQEVAHSAPLGDRLNMLYSGCSVAYGRGKAVVVETSMNTEMGKIASLLEGESNTSTPLQKRLEKLGKSLGIMVLIICAVIFGVGLLRQGDPLEMFMTAISLAVAAIPEGLPAIVTIVLAIGVQRMVKKNAIIRRLPAVETLGSASVICSDKTGTLTQNRMTVVKVFADKDIQDVNDHVSEQVLSVLKFGALCNDGKVEQVDGELKHVGDPTETSIVAAMLLNGLEKNQLEQENPRLYEIPFDSDRKLMTTVHNIHGKNIVVVKGGPDILLSRCTSGNIEQAHAANEDLSKQALRVLAVGYKEINEVRQDMTSDELENNLTFVGLIGMIDPPRPEVIDAIKLCKSAGIRTVMITGDHVTTAAAIAEQLGILNQGDQAITGAQLAAMSDDVLAKEIRNISVYARVSPEDKIRIVKAWQDSGEVVSMTGDGVNDAPALKAADIGCAMGITGTDVAKGAADMTLTDDNFSTIVSAVKEGRGIYDNIKKAVGYLIGCNIGEVICVFTAMILWNASPLLAIQILIINLVTDTLPALALGMEPPEYDIMERKPRRKNEGIFAGGLGVDVAIQGILIGGITLAGYWLGRFYFDGGEIMGRTMAMTVLCLAQLFHGFNCRSSHSLFKIGLRSNKYMIGAFFGSLLILGAILFIPPLQMIFGVTTLPLQEWEWMIGLSILPIIVVELFKFCKYLYYKNK